LKALQVAGKIVLTFGICIILGIIFNLMLKVIMPDPDQLPEQLVYLTNGPKSLFVILGATAIMLAIFKRDREWPLGLQGPGRVLLSAKGFLYGILLMMVTIIAVYCVGEASIVSYDAQATILTALAVGTFLALCDTFSEEILFRGYIQGMVKTSYGPWAAIVVSSVPFAVSHSMGHDVLSHPFELLNLVLAGIFLALLRELTGSLWLPIGMHFAWNSFNRLFGEADRLVKIEFGPNEWISGGASGFENGLANTLIMLTIIAILGLKLNRGHVEKREAAIQ